MKWVKKYKYRLSKTQLALVAILFLVSSFITIFSLNQVANADSPYTQGKGSSADVGTRIDVTAGWTPQQRVMSTVYERALIACMGGGNYFGASITAQDALDFQKWDFLSGSGNTQDAYDGTVTSILLDPDDGRLNCKNENGWLDEAFDLWQIDSNIEALCILGFTRTVHETSGASARQSELGYENCMNGPGNTFRSGYKVNEDGTGTVTQNVTQERTINALKNARGINFELDDAHTYLLYKYVFETQGKAGESCGATRVIGRDDPAKTPDHEALLDSKQAVLVKEVVLDDPSDFTTARTADYIYQFQEGSNENTVTRIANYTYLPLFSQSGITSPATDGRNECAFIKDRMNDLVGSFLDAVKDGLINITTAVAPPACESGDPACAASTKTCAVPSVGWIVCPVFNLLAGITDNVYAIIKEFLKVEPTIFDTSKGAYGAWEIARNLANIGFVIVFLIIIISQVSSVGITNYGIKKMLPRLIVAAILVNASYFICQLAVDISNILGNSIQNILTNVPAFKSATDFWSGNNAVQSVTQQVLLGTAVIAAGTVVVASAVMAGVGLLVPVLLGALLAVAVTFLILIGRQAIIILLVVVAPLAFLAMLLPNTENLFKQWRKIFVAMLVLFPMIALLYGGSQLAGSILMTTIDNDLGKIAAAAVGIIPLIATPAMLKSSLNAIPALGNIASKMQSRANGLAGKKAGELYRSSAFARGRAIRKQAKENYRTERFAKGIDKGGFQRIMASGVPLTEAGRRGNEALSRSAAGILNEAEEKEIRNSDARLANMRVGDGQTPLTTAQLMQIYRGEDVTHDGKAGGKILHGKSQFKEFDRIAAVQRAAAVANVVEANSMLSSTTDASMPVSVRKAAAKAIGTSSVVSKAPWLGGKTVAAAEQTGITDTAATLSAIVDGKLSAAALAAGDDASSEHLVKTVTDAAGDDAATLSLKAKAREMLRDEASKVYAPGSHLHEQVTSGSRKEGFLDTMQKF